MENRTVYLDSCTYNRPFDYTEWRKDNLFVGMTVEDISKAAMEVYTKENHT
ncbi:MAG: hypothetical protein LBC73_00890 [Oscillospiraceae bacterium]|jgi:hypothetical protein|nr:hypothetical protein [Oscillospiraceae bacterium]